jgi:peptidyl-prolyl cis-trans isomerase D
MARNPRQPLVTKKHLARIQREELQRKYLLIGSGVVLALVVLIIVFGILNETYLKQRQPVAVVNGEQILTSDFQARVRYERQQTINNALYLIQVFGSSPEMASFISSQIQDASSRLEPEVMGEQVLDDMVNETIIRQEATKRGITVTSQDIDLLIQESLGYYPNGTPTSQPTLEILPTSTLSSLQLTAVPPTPTATQVLTPTATPTATATATLVPTITPTSLPTITPTPYTQQGYEDTLKERITELAGINFSEADLRKLADVILYSQQLQEAVLEELGVGPTEEQVWARHILVPDQATADLVLGRLNAGEDWCELAASFSTDTSNKDNCGDLNWFGRERMVAEFETAAYAMAVGEISEPVQTSFGFHVIQVLGHENRPLDQSTYESKSSQAFQDWLEEQRTNSDVEILEIWRDRVPSDPAAPSAIQEYLLSIQNTSNPLQPEALPTP